MDGTRMDAPAADGTPSESTHDQTEGDIDLLCDKLDQGLLSLNYVLV